MKDGNIVIIKFGTYTFIGQRSAGLSFSADILDTTVKDVARFKENIQGERGLEISVDGITPYYDNSSIGTIFARWKNRDIADIFYQSTENPSDLVKVKGFIRELSITFNKNEPVSYSATFAITEAPEYVVYN